ncbi:type IV pilus modification PilV family protein [Mariprofundus micogutta]|uniref:type IV pilus modification PilV family protein n=1 Tax=Mariprofundus micogutta TaxID=1921010 RepID=UPI001D108575|nr:prepilin-type N-terminal cleavage/methylation domain-containing protein [Mariprofundus micogutta]
MTEYRSAGFTLIEILVSLTIVSIAVLALGGFGVSSLSSGQVSRERLTAVHLAEQVLEHWQHDANDRAPLIATGTCALTDATSAPSYPVTTTCKPSTGVGIAFTIAVNETQATGPLSSNLSAYQTLTQPTGYLNSPMTRLVTVSWSNKGVSRSIYLTHIAEPRI